MERGAALKRTTPLPRKRATPRRKPKVVCITQRCNRRGPFIQGLCIKHADEQAWRIFSLFIRARDGRCTANAVLGNTACQGRLQAAHIIGRTAKPTKYDPRNVHALCEAHHLLVDSAAGHEAFKYLWATSIIGREVFDELHRLAATTTAKRAIVVAEALATYAPEDIT